MSDAEWTQYRRTNIAEMIPWDESIDPMSRVSVSAADRDNGSPKPGDMIARNPSNHDDMWLVAAKYFAENFTPLTPPEPSVEGGNPETTGMGIIEGKMLSNIKTLTPGPRPPAPIGSQSEPSVEEVIELAKQCTPEASRFDLTWYDAGSDRGQWTVSGWSRFKVQPQIQKSATTLTQLAAKLKSKD